MVGLFWERRGKVKKIIYSFYKIHMVEIEFLGHSEINH